MLADVDVVAIVQGSALDAEIIHKSTVKAVEILNDHAAGFEIDFRVMVGHREVVHRQVVVRGAADGYGPGAHGNLFHDFVFKHEAELRHLNFLLYHSNLNFCAVRRAATKTIPWNPCQAAQSRQ